MLTGSERMVDSDLVTTHSMLHGLVSSEVHGVCRAWQR